MFSIQKQNKFGEIKVHKSGLEHMKQSPQNVINTFQMLKILAKLYSSENCDHLVQIQWMWANHHNVIWVVKRWHFYAVVLIWNCLEMAKLSKMLFFLKHLSVEKVNLPVAGCMWSGLLSFKGLVCRFGKNSYLLSCQEEKRSIGYLSYICSWNMKPQSGDG